MRSNALLSRCGVFVCGLTILLVAVVALAGNDCETLLVGSHGAGMWPSCGGSCPEDGTCVVAVVEEIEEEVTEWELVWDPNANMGLGAWVYQQVQVHPSGTATVAFCACMDESETLFLGTNYCCRAATILAPITESQVKPGTVGPCNIPGCPSGVCTLQVGAFQNTDIAIGVCD